MLDDLRADEEQLLLIEEELRELTMKEADILLQLTEVRAAQQRARRLVAETKNRHAPIPTPPDESPVSIVQEVQEAQQSTDGEGRGDSTENGMRFEIVASHISQRFRWAVIGAFLAVVESPISDFLMPILLFFPLLYPLRVFFRSSSGRACICFLGCIARTTRGVMLLSFQPLHNLLYKIWFLIFI